MMFACQDFTDEDLVIAPGRISTTLQSRYARQSARIGETVAPLMVFKSEKSFGPGIAKRREISSWSNLRMLTAKASILLEVLEHESTLVNGNEHKWGIERKRGYRVGRHTVLARNAVGRHDSHASGEMTQDLSLFLGVE